MLRTKGHLLSGGEHHVVFHPIVEKVACLKLQATPLQLLHIGKMETSAVALELSGRGSLTAAKKLRHVPLLRTCASPWTSPRSLRTPCLAIAMSNVQIVSVV